MRAGLVLDLVRRLQPEVIRDRLHAQGAVHLPRVQPFADAGQAVDVFTGESQGLLGVGHTHWTQLNSKPEVRAEHNRA